MHRYFVDNLHGSKARIPDKNLWKPDSSFRKRLGIQVTYLKWTLIWFHTFKASMTFTMQQRIISINSRSSKRAIIIWWWMCCQNGIRFNQLETYQKSFNPSRIDFNYLLWMSVVELTDTILIMLRQRWDQIVKKIIWVTFCYHHKIGKLDSFGTSYHRYHAFCKRT